MGDSVKILIFTPINVTEHKRKGLELEQFFELSHDLLCIIASDFVIKRVNQSIENTLGYSINEILGTRVIDYVHPEDTYAVLSNFNKLFKSNLPRINFTIRVRCKDGTYKCIEWSNFPNHEERVVYAVGRDITEKKEEEDLIKSEERYRNLFETMVQGVIYYNSEGTIISANPAAESILGITLEQIQGRTLPDLHWKTIHKDGSNLTVDMLPSMIALTTGQVVKDVMIGIFNSAENDYRWININAMPQFRPGEKKPYQIYTIFHDITEKKRAIDALINARKKAEIAQRMASLGNMAAGIAHEINQPLNAIKIIVDSVLYLHEAGKNLSLEVILEKLEEVSKQVDRIDDVIWHMKTLMRNEHLDLAPCDLNKAVEASLRILDAQLSPHGILVNQKLKDKLPMVIAEQCGLEKVILNLLINAMQALNEAVKGNKEITITTFIDHDIVLEISDNARGIDEEIIDKIFDPFFTTKKVGEGMGLGLSIVFSTVTLFKGKISVRNNERGGATFRVEFQSKNNFLN